MPLIVPELVTLIKKWAPALMFPQSFLVDDTLEPGRPTSFSSVLLVYVKVQEEKIINRNTKMLMTSVEPIAKENNSNSYSNMDKAAGMLI